MTGNEVMMYTNTPLFDMEQEAGDHNLNSSLEVDPLLLESATPNDMLDDSGGSAADKELDLLHLLDEPLPSTTSANTKKRKKN